MIRWKIYKSKNKSSIRARNNMMNFYNWSNAIKQVGKKINADYSKHISERLTLIESEEVYIIKRNI